MEVKTNLSLYVYMPQNKIKIENVEFIALLEKYLWS